MKRLTYLGPVNSFTGYGLHATQIITDLQRLAPCYMSVRCTEAAELFGAKISMDIKQRFVRGPQPEDWELLLNPPNLMPTPGKKTAYFTMWEAENLPMGWVNMLNRAEVVILPCQWNVDCFRASGVVKPIRKIPLGIKPEVFNFKPAIAREQFVFGAAGRMGGGGKRKGLNEVIDLFQIAFPDNPNVRLKIKAFSDCGVVPLDDPRIEVTAAYLSEAAMADWYASLDCFVSLSRSEGWGLMPHQAMATGRPVIATNFGGQAEYLTNDNAYCVDYVRVPCQFNYEGYGMWAEPNPEHVVELMRYCANNPSEVHQRGVLAEQSVRHLTWDNSNRQLLSVLQEFKAL